MHLTYTNATGESASLRQLRPLFLTKYAAYFHHFAQGAERERSRTGVSEFEQAAGAGGMRGYKKYKRSKCKIDNTGIIFIINFENSV